MTAKVIIFCVCACPGYGLCVCLNGKQKEEGRESKREC